MSLFVQAAIGAIVWTLANVVYLDMRRNGVRGFGRIVAFWLGNPTTWITLLAVPEGRDRRFQAAPDDDDALFDEVRRDRESRRLPGSDTEATDRGGGRAAEE